MTAADRQAPARATRVPRALERRVARFVTSRDLLPAGSALLLLLSGGADSMAMLARPHASNDRLGLGITLEALHVDYARRGADSARDRALVAAACAVAGVRLHVVESGPPPAAELPGLGADVRYEAAPRLVEERRLDLVAWRTTATIRRRPCSIGWYEVRRAGRADRHASRDGRLVRPLLCLGGGEIREYCRRRGIAYGEDVTNAQPVYARNRLRLHVLPELRRVNPRVAETLADDRRDRGAGA